MNDKNTQPDATEKLEQEGVSFIKILVISKLVIIAVVAVVAYWLLKDI
mgnify:CR=1 FL=1